MRRYFRRSNQTHRRPRRRRNYNPLGRFSGKRNNTLLVVAIIVVLYLLWRYPDSYRRFMNGGPSTPSFPTARP